ncbi:unnamed protein product [Rotaria sp. Silwood2]|nr:unnamed protein product [Rotaria sp. Silwood2]
MEDLDDSTNKHSANDSFNQLFTKAQWISVILGNLSSRLSKRGGHGIINQFITVTNLRGENPKLRDNHAITTLACLELYTDNVAKLVYKYILNKDPSENNFDLHSPLKSGFSNLAQQLTIREESDEFGRSAQADMTNFMYNNLDFVLGKHECLTLQ